MNPNMMIPQMGTMNSNIPNMMGTNMAMPNTMDLNPNMMMGNNITYMPSDLESKIAKMERQIKRLDARMSRLENPYPSNNYNQNANNTFVDMNTSFNSNML